MASKLNDFIVDRVQFGLGATSTMEPKYVLTQCSSANFEITADPTDITDKDGSLVYRKYSGKQGNVTLTNTFISTSIISTLSGTDAQVASKGKEIIVPFMKEVKAGSQLDVTGYVEGTVHVKAIGLNGVLDDTAYTLGSSATTNEFFINTTNKGQDGEKSLLELPTDEGVVKYFVTMKRKVSTGVTKITNSANKLPKVHELFLKALVLDPCDKKNLLAAIIHIPSFMPSPEMTLAIEGGDSQNMDLTGAMMVDYCSADKELFSVYIIEDEEDDDV